MPATVQPTTTWTILSLIEWGTRYLSDRSFEDPRLNIELLLAHILGLKRIELYTSFDRPLNANELAAFKDALRRRLAHEPLQYIIGKTEFMGISLAVNRSVLIPRPETEELVQKAVEWINRLTQQRVDVLDIGTGSCNIPIAIERLAQNAWITSIDVSEQALALAEHNMRRTGSTRIVLKQSDVFEASFAPASFDVIVSNPPYISAAEFVLLQPEVREFEPTVATTDNADGLTFIRRICSLAATTLRHGGMLFVEIAYNQGTDAARAAQESGLADVQIHRDVAGNERILQARRLP